MYFIAVDVDDIVLAGKSDEKMFAVKQAIGQQFQIKDMGELHYFLGVKVVRDFKIGNVWIGQQSYMDLHQLGQILYSLEKYLGLNSKILDFALSHNAFL